MNLKILPMIAATLMNPVTYKCSVGLQGLGTTDNLPRLSYVQFFKDSKTRNIIFLQNLCIRYLKVDKNCVQDF